MTRLTVIVLALCMLTAAAVPASAEIKIGYIDTVKIFANYKETIEAEEVYKKEVEVWKKQAEEMETELARMREEIQSQSLMLSAEKLEEKRLVFDQRMKDYQKYMQDIFGETGEAARRNKELTEPIVEKINGIIEIVAEEEGFTLVLDSSQGVIVYADKEIDITDMIIARLDTQMETTQ
ncbi:MAG: OmpH family outer membrane protein [Candidatus Krumholzibacteria bacterium]|nr:OmpH family outer membrane protein [Candidatus Krumholzibacteria bacterium]